MTMARTSAIRVRPLLRDGGLLAGFDAAPVKAAEVDRVEQQRREAALAGEIGDEAPCERKQKRRAFDEQSGWIASSGRFLSMKAPAYTSSIL